MDIKCHPTLYVSYVVPNGGIVKVGGKNGTTIGQRLFHSIIRHVIIYHTYIATLML